MPSSLSSIAAKDGTSTTVAGGILAVDKSGAGTGPFFAAQTLVDTQGVNTATLKAASTAPVATDTALVVAIHPLSQNSNGQKTMANSAPVVIASDQSAVPVSPSAQTSGGVTPFSAIAGAGTNATNVKASAGQIYKIDAFNNAGTIAYLKIYDSASAPTAGSGTPKKRIMIPANSGVALSYDVGETYTSGIGFTLTGAIGDADTTAVSANQFLINISYK